MHQDDRDIEGVSSPDHGSALCEQQTVLLNRINALTRDAAIHGPPNSGDIYTLKQEYNLLVKKRAKLARSPLSDPIDVLPSELWPDIIRNIVEGGGYPVNKLLDLISVSKGWCSALTALPVIWTHIRLDPHEPDYLAKAIMCIQLSGECEIDLFIRHLTVDEWQGISSMIVPEGKRIRRLSFVIRGDGFMVTRQVLGDFTTLPVLRKLFLPNRPSQLSDQQYIHALLTEKMPSIKTVNTPWCFMQDQIWNPYPTTFYLTTESFTREAVETLMLIPRLHHLKFVETARTPENTPSLLKSSSVSVTKVTYTGTDICRHLAWIGNNLLTLSTHYYADNGDASALLVALSRFPHLHKLTVRILPTNRVQPIQNEGHIAIPRNSVRDLRLESFQGGDGADWNVFFSIFFPSSPFLEVLMLHHNGIITDMGWNSIQSIKNLRHLHIHDSNIHDSSSIPLNMESLRHFRLTARSHSLAQVLARLQSKFLRTLRLKERESYDSMASTPHTVAGAGIFLSTVTTMPYIVAGGAFPNITSLVISNEISAPWELRGLSKLRELEVQAPSQNFMMYWVSGILEAILTQPRDTPALEKITFTRIFVEWDILFLMLERRNFLNEPAISSIKTLVFDQELPYRLLYPLSELLGGRFVERDSNQSFSLEAIGGRMLDESLPGCMECHSSFRECESPLRPSHEVQNRPKVAAGGDKANEYLLADPPLPPEMKLWLSGRRERLIKFMRRYEETGGQSHRPSWCDISRPRSERIVITGDTLVGAHFGRDLEE